MVGCGMWRSLSHWRYEDHPVPLEAVERNGPGTWTRSYTTSGVLMAEACAQRVNRAVDGLAKMNYRSGCRLMGMSVMFRREQLSRSSGRASHSIAS